MKKIFTTLSIALVLCVSVSAQNINGRFSSSVYAFERFDTTDVSNHYIRSYQMLTLNINQGNFSLRSNLNYESDLSKNLTDDPRLRFYNLYFEARNIFNIATIKLGRQPIINSVAGGLFDGLTVNLKKNQYKFSGYYGGNVPAYQKLELINNWSDNFILGGKFIAAPFENWQFGLSYINKNYKTEDYWATRLDANLNPIQVLIANNSNQYQFATAEVSYYQDNFLSVNTRFDYDINFEKASRFEIDGRYDQVKNLGINVYYNFREPTIRYNSIFSVFDYGNTQEIEIGGDYKLFNNLTVLGKFGNVTYKDDNSQRFTIGLVSGWGSLNYRKTLGYEGELDALSLYSAYSFLDGLLTPSIGLSYANYKLSADSEKDNLTTLLAGFNIRPFRFLSVDLQGQYMNNRIYKDDYRFFLKLNYWFNKNF